RSSATAEDLADASFAGQQDTFLSIETEEGLLGALRGCWASLFTERAVSYRRQRGIESAQVSMAVVIQRMVRADAAGVLFTADPLNGRRGVSVIEAVAGLGEALVSGHAKPERYRVRASDRVVLERLGSDGAPLAPDAGLLKDHAIEALCALGARAEVDAGVPQDIEWAMEDGRLSLLQARAITTLWPLPEGEGPPGWRVFLSFGHVQMYTPALSRVGSSLFRRLIPAYRDERTGLSSLVRVAGERLYIDVTPLLAREPFGTLLPRFVAVGSEPIAARLAAAKQRDELRALPRGTGVSLWSLAATMLPIAGSAMRVVLGDPENARSRYLTWLHRHQAQQQARLDRARGVAERLEVLFDELGGAFEWLLLRGACPRLMPALVIEKLLAQMVPWLLPDGDYRVLLQGLEGNVTTEMDLALSDLADLARDVPSLVAALRSDDARAVVAALRGDPALTAFFAAWDAFLARHGHRSVGEIDPAVARFREDPRVPLRSIAGALDRPRGALREQHASLARRALARRDELIAAARRKPLGALLAPFVGALVDRARVFFGVREEHKFVIVETVDQVRGVVLEAGALLVREGALASLDEVWLLELNELLDAVRAVEEGRVPSLRALVVGRRASKERY
ncbi:MAG: PEP/pyruvate-binding domain-containing protein, partial [Byssovorax sp.]